MAKVNYRKITMDACNEVGKGFDEKSAEFEAMVKYVTEWWDVAGDPQAAKDAGLTPKEYKLTSIGNGLLDGAHYEYMEEETESDDQPKGQEIVEVNQDEVKKALKALVTRENETLSFLYDMHAEYNAKYFYGQLSHPFITIEKLSNKTLGNYTHGEDAMGITNHIRFNRNFIALNEMERILETLRHEMIHQWQDEVLYMAEGVAAHKVKMPVGFGKFLDKNEPAKLKWAKDGTPVGEMVDQIKRPKEWHNRDFKEYAVVVDIPAKGDKCYGNIANMPIGKSYNRKFSCQCLASNNSFLTIWSTRPVHAVCEDCGEPFVEQEKAGELIPVVLSTVEAPGTDAIELKMKGKGYTHFQKFGSKKEKDAFVESLYATDIHGEGLEVEQGFYLKGNNAYKEGFTHWVAYNGLSEVFKKNAKKEKPAAKKPEPKKVVELPKEEEPKEKPKAKKPAAPKKPKKVIEPKDDVKVEVPKEEPKKPSKVVQLPAEGNPERTHTNPEDLLSVYKETGSIKGVAEFFGMTSANILYHAKKLGVDFKKGEIKDAVKS